MPFAEMIPPAESAPPLMLGEAHSHIERSTLRPNSYTLSLRGYLTTGWTGRLASGMAGHGIGIVRGEAERDAGHVWSSRLELATTSRLQQPFGIDYVALAQKEPLTSHRAERIELHDFMLEPPHRHGGSLYLEIRGEDRLGFLGDLLDYFSFKCLFPVKMRIETFGAAVYDKFWLRGVGGSVPSEHLYLTLRQDLEGLRRVPEEKRQWAHG